MARYERITKKAGEVEGYAKAARGSRREWFLTESVRLRSQAQGIVNHLARVGVVLQESPGGITWSRRTSC